MLFYVTHFHFLFLFTLRTNLIIKFSQNVLTQSAMNEAKSQLEVSNTAVAFQYQTTYSHCPAVMPQSNIYTLYSNNQCHTK